MDNKKSILVSETTHTKLKLYCSNKGQKIGFAANFILSKYIKVNDEFDFDYVNYKDDLTEKCIMIDSITHNNLKKYCLHSGNKIGSAVDFILNKYIDNNTNKKKL